MRLDYTLDQKVPFIKSVLFGIQWAAVLIPSIIILGEVAAGVHLLDASGQIHYLRNLFTVNELFGTKDQDKRISKGIFITGTANILSGFLGVIGPVNYSMSPGRTISGRL
jgi:xanthine/uracil permease